MPKGGDDMMKASGKRMRDRRSKRRVKGPERVRYSPVPEFITCPYCGFEMELWSGEEETRCLVCGHRFFRREATVH